MITKKLLDWKIFARFALGRTVYWSKMDQLAQDILRGGRFSIAGANGVGKSITISDAALLWWLRKPDAKLLVTSSSWTQLQHGLWSYIRQNVTRINHLGFEIDHGAEKITDGQGHFILAISPRKPENLAGIHGNVGVIVDEGSGVPEWVEESMEGLQPSLVVISYNPLVPLGFAHQTFQDPDYKHYTFSALDHPNVRLNKEVIPGAVMRKDVERIARRFGTESAVYVARVLGQFPDSSTLSVFPPSLIALSLTHIVPDEPRTRYAIGVDLAQGGSNDTVITLVGTLSKGITLPGIPLEQIIPEKQIILKSSISIADVAKRTIELAQSYRVDPKKICVDATGMGIGLKQKLREEKWFVTGVNFASKARNKEKYANIRAEMTFKLREKMEQGLLVIPAGKFDELISQMNPIQYGYEKDGRLKIESKVSMKSRGVKSPDRVDSLMLAVFALEARRNFIFEVEGPVIS